MLLSLKKSPPALYIGCRNVLLTVDCLDGLQEKSCYGGKWENEGQLEMRVLTPWFHF